jgi:hypothetical protein
VQYVKLRFGHHPALLVGLGQAALICGDSSWLAPRRLANVRWVVTRYFGTFNPSRRDRWVVGDHASGRYLRKFAWTPIVRRRMVPGTASVDDPALGQAAAQQQTPAGHG